MTELILVVGRTKAEVVDALKIKVMLDRMGVGVMGVILKKGGDEDIPPEFVEDLLKLKVMTDFNINA